MHFVRSKNLPFSLDQVKKQCNECRQCAIIKPRYFKPPEAQLIKATRPWERVSVDFKGPVDGNRRFMLVMVDEYSRFPFVLPCKDMSAATVISCFTSIFCMMGLPEYVHSDRSNSFIGREVTEFLVKKGIATSRSTPYHPTGNSQCERMNQTVWRTVKLLLASKGLPETKWETVLPDALNSIRSLLCTSTNETPHSRFFSFPRRSMLGNSLPDWLLEGGEVLLKRHVRTKNQPLCDPVELIEANPKFSLIEFPDGRQSTVSNSDLAPYPTGTEDCQQENLDVEEQSEVIEPVDSPDLNSRCAEDPEQEWQGPKQCQTPEPVPLRKSTRIRKAPIRYGVD